MELHVDDDGFVRAPAPLVYQRLTDIGGYDAWWPGLSVARVEAPEETWHLRMRDGLTRLEFRAVPGTWRLDTGFVLSLSGDDLEGRAEFWLERVGDGTTVHHLLVATTVRRRPLRVLRAYRRVLRRGLWAFKDLVQTEVRTDAGLHP